MILIAAAAAILIGFLFVPLAQLVARPLADDKTQTPTEAYFLTGILLTASLSLTPALFMIARDYGRGMPFGMTESQIFSRSFLVFWALFVAFLTISRNLGIQRWNFWILFALAFADTTVGVWFLKTYADVRFDDWTVLILSVLAIAIFPAQLTLARIHSRCAKALVAQPIIPPDAAR